MHIPHKRCINSVALVAYFVVAVYGSWVKRKGNCGELTMKRYCLALDLKDDTDLIEEYKEYHRAVWPEIKQSIVSSGIVDMQIYLTGNRLFMMMETDDSFSFEGKAAADAANPVVQKWEDLMWNFQQPLPQTKPNEKWMLMEQIFSLAD
jgi:L-rhamnose mutarotase